MNRVLTPGIRSSNQPCICFRNTSESSKRQSTRGTGLPSRGSPRGANGFGVTLGGKPIGFRTVIFSATSHLRRGAPGQYTGAFRHARQLEFGVLLDAVLA